MLTLFRGYGGSSTPQKTSYCNTMLHLCNVTTNPQNVRALLAGGSIVDVFFCGVCQSTACKQQRWTKGKLMQCGGDLLIQTGLPKEATCVLDQSRAICQRLHCCCAGPFCLPRCTILYVVVVPVSVRMCVIERLPLQGIGFSSGASGPFEDSFHEKDSLQARFKPAEALKNEDPDKEAPTTTRQRIRARVASVIREGKQHQRAEGILPFLLCHSHMCISFIV